METRFKIGSLKMKHPFRISSTPCVYLLSALFTLGTLLVFYLALGGTV